MRKDDLIRLRHMLDAAREAMRFAQSQTRGSLDTDRMLTLAIVKSLEILGEAASKVSRKPATPCPSCPGPVSSA